MKESKQEEKKKDHGWRKEMIFCKFCKHWEKGTKRELHVPPKKQELHVPHFWFLLIWQIEVDRST